ncbi:hypothetical protein Afil01_20310 [Actinorhabdospora filicis]|uniref:Uncharacterized protein n=1 Tax=Actinorhabdospora filicis TaxID=1785913 RepID=A0A9W6W849_9ACTN|nr:hypothetical protein [Actinorhabdospora filicis]GLZ77224.1 hypothetical protein Afil01_20310 [Actinorhabdospora filicis]
MSRSTAHHPPSARRAVSATAALVLGLTWTIAPAGAAQARDCLGTTVLAASGAELLRVSALDLRAFGVNLPPVSDNRLSTGGSAVSSEAKVKARATAELYQGDLPLDALGPASSPGKSVLQTAPPQNDAPQTTAIAARDLGLVHSGAGEISARAVWPKRLGCGESGGPITETHSSLSDLRVLPGGVPLIGREGASLLALPGTAAASTGTELVRTKAGTDGVGAHAAASMADLYLMRGTTAQSRIRMLAAPTLSVVTDGTKKNGSVTYTAPLLEIQKPGGGTLKLDSPEKSVEYGLPSSSLLEGGGPLGRNPLSGLLSVLLGDLGLPSLGSASTEGLQIPAIRPEPDPSLPVPGLAGTGLPDLGLDSLGLSGPDLPSEAPPSTGTAEAADLAELLTVRLSLGTVRFTVYDRAVVAEASSMRVQVFAKLPGGARFPVLDAGIGLLSAAVALPAPIRAESSPAPVPSLSTTRLGTDAPKSVDVAGKSDSLALTGIGGVLTLLGVGVLLVIAGRGIHLLAKRRGGD